MTMPLSSERTEKTKYAFSLASYIRGDMVQG